MSNSVKSRNGKGTGLQHGDVSHGDVSDGDVSDGNVSLPATASVPASGDLPNGTAATEKKTVLIIDDDPAVRSALKFSLEIDGFSVRCYASPAEFLAAADMPPQACLVVDEKMPGASGLDMLIALAVESRVALPAILITSYPSAELRRRADLQGIPILEKPFLNNALSEAIIAAMSRTS